MRDKTRKILKNLLHNVSRECEFNQDLSDTYAWDIEVCLNEIMEFASPSEIVDLELELEKREGMVNDAPIP